MINHVHASLPNLDVYRRQSDQPPVDPGWSFASGRYIVVPHVGSLVFGFDGIVVDNIVNDRVDRSRRNNTSEIHPIGIVCSDTPRVSYFTFVHFYIRYKSDLTMNPRAR